AGHTDQDGLHVADVGLQREEVAAIIVAADDDEHRPPREIVLEIREAGPGEQQVALALDEVDRVPSEALELFGQRHTGPLHRGGNRLLALQDADRRYCSVEKDTITLAAPLGSLDALAQQERTARVRPRGAG